MTTLINRNETKREVLTVLLGAAILILSMFFVTQFGFADPSTEMIKGVVSILKTIMNVVGVIFGLVGIVQFAMAQAQDDGPAKQKAIMFMATGILLVVAGTLVLDKLKPETWITKQSN